MHILFLRTTHLGVWLRRLVQCCLLCSDDPAFLDATLLCILTRIFWSARVDWIFLFVTWHALYYIKLHNFDHLLRDDWQFSYRVQSFLSTVREFRLAVLLMNNSGGSCRLMLYRSLDDFRIERLYGLDGSLTDGRF